MKRTFIVAATLCLLGQQLAAQRIVITYFSETGHTKAMAEAVAKGVRNVPGAEVRLLTVDKTSTDDLLWADGIIVGSPVRNANVAAPVLESMARWPFNGQLQNKVGAAFVSGGGISAGEELTQMALIHSMMIYGMIIVGGPTWESAFGASAITDEKPFIDVNSKEGVSPQFLLKAEGLGKRVAEVAQRLSVGKK